MLWEKSLRAFTLIELLVVITIIALLTAILIPALRIVKMKASAVICLTNTKNLSLAWYFYQGDNKGRIMSSLNTGREPDGHFVGWIAPPHNEAGNSLYNYHNAVSPPITDADEIRGIERGLLFEYLEDPDVYHCPGDLRKGSDGTRVFAAYLVAMCLYGKPNPKSSGVPEYDKQIRKFSEITSPSLRYVFVESAEERNFNVNGWFSLNAAEYFSLTGVASWAWWNPLAVNHSDSSTLGFADGHAESHRWRNEFTLQRVDKLKKTGAGSYGIDVPPPNETEDIRFMARGWPYQYH